jgi:predicted nucleotidyltransferase
MNNRIFDVLKDAKAKYEPEGFIILGVFGSYARGEETSESDVDILYEVTPEFIYTTGGWGTLYRLDCIRNELEALFGLKVDIADKSALREIGKKYILPEVRYV